MPPSIDFTLQYSGNEAEDNEIDLYDVAQALIGFQRSLALTTHLIINDQIITQAPSLKGAQIFASLPEDGSWKLPARIILASTAIYTAGTAPPDTPLGHLIRSAYDYVVNETMGFHVDFKSTLGKQYEELQERKENQIPILRQHRFDSLLEKCEVAVREMHRPIYGSNTATIGTITSTVAGHSQPFKNPLTYETYEYVRQTRLIEYPQEFEGRVSSYNSNTYRGRFFILEEGRPVAFELHQDARNASSVEKIMASMTMYTRYQFDKSSDGGFIKVRAFKNVSKNDRIKSISIINVL